MKVAHRVSKVTIPSTDPPKKFIVERLFLVAVLKFVIFPVSLKPGFHIVVSVVSVVSVVRKKFIGQI